MLSIRTYDFEVFCQNWVSNVQWLDDNYKIHVRCWRLCVLILCLDFDWNDSNDLNNVSMSGIVMFCEWNSWIVFVDDEFSETW